MKLITKAEACRLLGISRPAMDALIQNNNLPVVKSGQTTWIRTDVLENLGK